MTVNELIGKIEARIKQLGKLSLKELRQEHPDLADGNGEGRAYSQTICKLMTAGKSREDIIAEIIAEEFSLKYDLEIEDT